MQFARTAHEVSPRLAEAVGAVLCGDSQTDFRRYASIKYQGLLLFKFASKAIEVIAFPHDYVWD